MEKSQNQWQRFVEKEERKQNDVLKCIPIEFYDFNSKEIDFYDLKNNWKKKYNPFVSIK